tara:strand:+ start:229 stop:1587 length:1359 start_codon:yes stop_codon:yes gene_type:complete
MSDNKKKLEFDQIIDWFKSGEKKKNDWLIGTEHEKFIFNKDNYERTDYNGQFGIGKILDQISLNDNWSEIKEGDNLIGLKHVSGSSISLEPGGQFELSGAPLKNLHQTCKEAGLHLQLMKKIADHFELLILGLGHDPKSSRNDIKWMPKQRYKIMREYMPKVGKLGLDMMLRTCTIQVNLDYSSEADMIKKFQTSIALQSVSTALFANSPFLDGKPGKFLSQRAFVWTDTDKDRTGVPNNIFMDNFGYKSWSKYLMSVPMYFVYRDGKYIDVSGQSFSDFMLGKLDGLEGEFPTLSDWQNHSTVAFPEVRLKQYLEMRGADGGPWSRICALPALWVGLLYDEKSLNDAYNLSKDFMQVNILEKARFSAAKEGLNGFIGKVQIKEIAKEILNISYQGLKRRNNLDEKGISETQYLDPLLNIIENDKTSAEELLERYNNVWSGNINKIFEKEVF